MRNRSPTICRFIGLGCPSLSRRTELNRVALVCRKDEFLMLPPGLRRHIERAKDTIVLPESANCSLPWLLGSEYYFLVIFPSLISTATSDLHLGQNNGKSLISVLLVTIMRVLPPHSGHNTRIFSVFIAPHSVFYCLYHTMKYIKSCTRFI